MDYFRIAKLTFKNPWLLNPQVHVKRVDQLDFSKIRQLGVKYIIFDKDNTLTAHLESNYFNEEIKNCIETSAKQHFHPNNSLFVVSNSMNSAEKIENSLGLQLITTKTKKPQNFLEILQHIRKHNQGQIIRNHEIAFIGDRLFTDVLLANSNGAVSVLTDPLSSENESLGITVMRKIENVVLSSFGKERSKNLFFTNQKIDLQQEFTGGQLKKQ